MAMETVVGLFMATGRTLGTTTKRRWRHWKKVLEAKRHLDFDVSSIRADGRRKRGFADEVHQENFLGLETMAGIC
jgi:hypothetical protein